MVGFWGFEILNSKKNRIKGPASHGFGLRVSEFGMRDGKEHGNCCTI